MRKHLGDWLLTPEPRRKAANRLLVTLIWLAIITLLRWSWRWNLVFLWVGGIAGTFLLDVDHLLYLLIIYPQKLTSLRVRELWRQRRIREGLVLAINTSQERTRLPFHSALFQPILYVLCFFVLTSTGSLFGAGLVMAMALHLLKIELDCLLQGREEFLRKWLFWQVQVQISLKNQKFFILLMLLVFLGLNLLLI